MGLFNFFKRKSAQSTNPPVAVPIPVERELSNKPEKIDPYTQERGRILSILADQAMQFPDSPKALLIASFAKNTIELDRDYATSRDTWCCCDKCAPYRNRIYSISGKDKRIPKLPDFFLDISNWEHCGVCLTTANEFMLEVNRDDLIARSNRPFIDDRTPEQKENYQNYLAEKQAEAEKAQDKEDYAELSALYPDSVPKSFGAYRRLRNSNPDKFEEIRNLLNK